MVGQGIGIGIEHILHPLPHIAQHVVQAEGIRLVIAHRGRVKITVVAFVAESPLYARITGKCRPVRHIGIRAGFVRVVAPEAHGGAPATGRVFPLSFRGQNDFLPALCGQPFGKGLGIVPGHCDHRMTILLGKTRFLPVISRALLPFPTRILVEYPGLALLMGVRTMSRIPHELPELAHGHLVFAHPEAVHAHLVTGQLTGISLVVVLPTDQSQQVALFRIGLAHLKAASGHPHEFLASVGFVPGTMFPDFGPVITELAHTQVVLKSLLRSGGPGFFPDAQVPGRGPDRRSTSRRQSPPGVPSPGQRRRPGASTIGAGAAAEPGATPRAARRAA